MRIISGKYRGKILNAPKNLPVRPTADMQKEALFNVLTNYYNFENISVLDLFSGTGNVAFEFASRGSKFITAVDEHEGCVKFIRKTAQQLDFPIQVLQAEVLSYLSKNHQLYDVIFADPPYDLALEKMEQISAYIFQNEWLTPEGMLIVEHSVHSDLSHQKQFKFAKTYGGTVFSFFEP